MLRMRAKRTAVSDDPLQTPRAKAGRAPDVFQPGGWIPMREHADGDTVDFVVVGTGAGGGTLACKLAESGFSVVAMDAGPYFRPLEDFASDELEQTKLYWTDDRLVDGDNPIQMGSNNSGKAVGGSTCAFRHGFAAVSAGVVQSSHCAWLWSRLAARLARNVEVLC